MRPQHAGIPFFIQQPSRRREVQPISAILAHGGRPNREESAGGQQIRYLAQGFGKPGAVFAVAQQVATSADDGRSWTYLEEPGFFEASVAVAPRIRLVL